MKIKELLGLNGSKNGLLCMGQAGRGKSELALNLAVKLQKESMSTGIIDLDYTKGHFRSGDKKDDPAFAGVQFLSNPHPELDIPFIPGPGDLQRWNDVTNVIVDVAGDSKGILCAGQLCRLLENRRIYGFYVLNPYRGNKRLVEEMEESLEFVRELFPSICLLIVANPNIGYFTDEPTWKRGMEQLEEMMGSNRIDMSLCAGNGKEFDEGNHTFFIKLFIPATIREL